MNGKIVTIFGGSGFIGRHLVRRLAAQGWRIRVAVRHPPQAGFLQPMGDVGQINAVPASVTNEASVAAAVRNATAVINLVGILSEGGGATFQAIHADGAGRVARLARAAGARSLIHVSALGADAHSDSSYARSKAAGELQVQDTFPEAVILRPSVVFGPEDDFFNRFSDLAGLSPVLPVFIGKGLSGEGPSFQPVYVGDVADAIMTVLRDPAHQGKLFELGGPLRYSMRRIMEMVLHYTDRCRVILPVPLSLAVLPALVLQNLPAPPLTRDQLRLLARDNVLKGAFSGFEALGIVPTAAETILPSYLRPSGPGTRMGIAPSKP